MTTERLEETETDADDEDDFTAEDIALGEAMDKEATLEERLARLTPQERAEALAQVKEDLAPSEFGKLLTYGEDAAAARADADALYAQQLQTAAEASPDYVAPPPPLTEIEEAAKVASTLDASALAEFTEMLREGNSKLMRDAAIKRGELTPEGEPLEPPTPAYDVSSLPAPAFNAFIRAAAAGGVVGTDPIPEGFTRDSWTAVVNSAMGHSEGENDA